ncbi:Ig-like domain-containing protein [Pseudooceanicola sp. C21-150M6]|uniref:Ig-like domain-containing protein n=1 Tax=Pseudooceanicola sp. C21-150M6 TaxID=3434355 RepID=UPI003D7F35C8
MSLSVNYTFQGNGNWSLDGVSGTRTDGGIIEVEVPEGSYVEAAFLYATTYSTDDYAGDVTVEGTVIDSSEFTPLGSPGFLQAFRTDVTSLIRSEVGSGSDTRFEIEVSDVEENDVDGYALVVVYSNPDEAERAIIFADGYSDFSGDTFSVSFPEPIDTTVEGFEALLSLGIGFGYQLGGGGQRSLVDIDGRRLTSSAGGQDDGDTNNGGLITIGGLDDDPANPTDPNVGPSNPRTDDELYDLAQGNGADNSPFLLNGDTGVTVTTSNPSNDDNIFFAGFNIVGEAVVDSEENDRPDARDDDYVTSEGTPLIGLDVLDNDIDPDGDLLSVVSADAVSVFGGTVVVNGDGSLSYTPAAGFTGTDTFTYTITDGDLTDTAVVTVEVEGDDTPPPPPSDGERIRGDANDNALVGGTGDDTVLGLDGDDEIEGGEGDDIAFGGAGDDSMDGGDDDDYLSGGSGDDDIMGGDGNDVSKGGDGDDYIDSGDGEDLAVGGDGMDTMLLGLGDDVFKLGTGLLGDGDADVLVLDTLNNGDDVVFGFEGGLDLIDLDGAMASVSFTGNHTLVDIDGGGSILLRNFSETDYDAVSGMIFTDMLIPMT